MSGGGGQQTQIQMPQGYAYGGYSGGSQGGSGPAPGYGNLGWGAPAGYGYGNNNPWLTGNNRTF